MIWIYKLECLGSQSQEHLKVWKPWCVTGVAEGWQVYDIRRASQSQAEEALSVSLPAVCGYTENSIDLQQSMFTLQTIWM